MAFVLIKLCVLMLKSKNRMLFGIAGICVFFECSSFEEMQRNIECGRMYVSQTVCVNYVYLRYPGQREIFGEKYGGYRDIE